MDTETSEPKAVEVDEAQKDPTPETGDTNLKDKKVSLAVRHPGVFLETSEVEAETGEKNLPSGIRIAEDEEWVKSRKRPRRSKTESSTSSSSETSTSKKAREAKAESSSESVKETKPKDEPKEKLEEVKEETKEDADQSSSAEANKKEGEVKEEEDGEEEEQPTTTRRSRRIKEVQKTQEERKLLEAEQSSEEENYDVKVVINRIKTPNSLITAAESVEDEEDAMSEPESVSSSMAAASEVEE